MPITRTPLVDDDGTGTTGTILNNAWQTGLYDQIDAAIAAGAATTTTDLGALATLLETAGACPDHPAAARVNAAVRRLLENR